MNENSEANEAPEAPQVFLGFTLEEWESKGNEVSRAENRVSGPVLEIEHFFARQPLDQIKELDKELFELVLDIKSAAERRVRDIDRVRRAIRDSGVTPYTRGQR